MCTVTFIAQGNGYCLGMNRDESLTRADGLPPRGTKRTLAQCSRRLNQRRKMDCAERQRRVSGVDKLVRVTENVERIAVSRGEVVKALARRFSRIRQRQAEELSLKRINPFRLIGVFPALPKSWSGVGT